MGVEFYLFKPDGPVDTAKQQEEMLVRLYEDELEELICFSSLKWMRDLDISALLTSFYSDFISAETLVEDGYAGLICLYAYVAGLHPDFHKILLGDGFLPILNPNDGEKIGVLTLRLLALSGQEIASISVSSPIASMELLKVVACVSGVPMHRQVILAPDGTEIVNGKNIMLMSLFEDELSSTTNRDSTYVQLSENSLEDSCQATLVILDDVLEDRVYLFHEIIGHHVSLAVCQQVGDMDALQTALESRDVEWGPFDDNTCSEVWMHAYLARMCQAMVRAGKIGGCGTWSY